MCLLWQDRGFFKCLSLASCLAFALAVASATGFGCHVSKTIHSLHWFIRRRRGSSRVVLRARSGFTSTSPLCDSARRNKLPLLRSCLSSRRARLSNTEFVHVCSVWHNAIQYGTNSPDLSFYRICCSRSCVVNKRIWVLDFEVEHHWKSISYRGVFLQYHRESWTGV